ncbi:MAG: 30S ribosomal protein S20 [Chloroflexota bacterium]|nr:30S ribosomal protein S20 [Chloroflexota bacterium]
MSSKKSSSKRSKVSERKRLRNRAVKSNVKTLRTRVDKQIAAKDESAHEEAVITISGIDRAVSKGVFHRNKAARLKSRLVKKLSHMASSPSK